MKNRRSINTIISSILLLLISIPTTLFLSSLLFTQYEALEKLCTPILGCIHVNKGALYYFFHLILFGLLPLTSAIGTLMRKAWGWWLSLFFYAAVLLSTTTKIIWNILDGSTVHIISWILFLTCLMFIVLFTRKNIVHLFQIKLQRKIVIYILLFIIAVMIYLFNELIIFLSMNPHVYGN
ncbi:hypothetical protein [Hazenella coriacea]|uniref:Uncharacterized protein n=1 Tax=Hazenella coriacea TaxID=1179467 RepID=A0A4R3L8Y1_9BACL|nr:hypothetical protein [Hazenella coriacea]TCS94674.1 hypothetical protein EDD58_10386 [Hazenella coriacea]